MKNLELKFGSQMLTREEMKTITGGSACNVEIECFRGDVGCINTTYAGHVSISLTDGCSGKLEIDMWCDYYFQESFACTCTCD